MERGQHEHGGTEHHAIACTMHDIHNECTLEEAKTTSIKRNINKLLI
jgi:hypothetical protein